MDGTVLVKIIVVRNKGKIEYKVDWRKRCEK